MAAKKEGTDIPSVEIKIKALSSQLSLFNAAIIPKKLPEIKAIRMAARARIREFGKASEIISSTPRLF